MHRPDNARGGDEQLPLIAPGSGRKSAIKEKSIRY
jgi:hypothetical protein